MFTKEDLIPLYNSLSQIPVSGNGAIMMGNALQYLQNLLNRKEPDISKAPKSKKTKEEMPNE